MCFSGQLGVILKGSWYKPLKDDEPDIDNTLNTAFEYGLGLFLEPLLGTGQLPVGSRGRAMSPMHVEKSDLLGNLHSMESLGP